MTVASSDSMSILFLLLMVIVHVRETRATTTSTMYAFLASDSDENLSIVARVVVNGVDLSTRLLSLMNCVALLGLPPKTATRDTSMRGVWLDPSGDLHITSGSGKLLVPLGSSTVVDGMPSSPSFKTDVSAFLAQYSGYTCASSNSTSSRSVSVIDVKADGNVEVTTVGAFHLNGVCLQALWEAVNGPQGCPVDCIGSWGPWGSCSATCNGGTQTRIFTVSRAAANGGVACPTPQGSSVSQSCISQSCPVNCVGSWSAWSTCSATCSGGSATRRFTVSLPAAYGGLDCVSAHGATESTSCNTQECTLNCHNRPDGIQNLAPGFRVYCQGGWALIQLNTRATCTSYQEKDEVGPHIKESAACGFLSRAKVQAIARHCTKVWLKCDGEESTSTNSLAIKALQDGVSWHNGATFSNWKWVNSPLTSADGWPGMFQSYGEGLGVHWIIGGNPHWHSKTTAQAAKSSTWLN